MRLLGLGVDFPKKEPTQHLTQQTRPAEDLSFGLVWLRHLLSSKLPFLDREDVAFQVDDKFLLFQDTGVHIWDATTDSTGMGMPNGTWALTDFHTSFDRPCPAFLTACVLSRA